MRITSLTLRNFKAVGPAAQRINFKPITLLFGPNSAGKSTVVQALHYLSEILNRNNCDPGTIQIGGKLNLGGFRNLVYLHDSDTSVELALGLVLEDTLLPSYGKEEDDEHQLLGEVFGSEAVFDLSQVRNLEVQLGVRWSLQFNRAYVASYAVNVDGEPFAHISSSADQRQIELRELNCSHPMFSAKLNEDAESPSVGEALQTLIDELTTAKASGSEERVISPLQVRSGRGAMPYFGSRLELESSLEDITPDISERIALSNVELARELLKKRAIIAKQEKLTALYALNAYTSRIVVGAGELARDCLQQFLYLGPLREIPGRHYIPELSPGLARWSSGLGAWDQLYSEGESLAGKINEWLSSDQRLNAGYEVHFKEYKPLPLDSPLMVSLQNGDETLQDSVWVQEQLAAMPSRRHVTLRDLRTNLDLHAEDLGTGISQVLPVLVAALGHNKSIVAIEQPELHVHPKFQVELGELFIHAIKHEHIARDTVFILETHSEYMMLRFLRRLYETTNNELPPDSDPLSPKDIAVYYVNPTGDSVEITHLRLTAEGEFLDRWPEGFFPERKRELF